MTETMNLKNMPSSEEVMQFVVESNAIERVYAGVGEPMFDHHHQAAKEVIVSAFTSFRLVMTPRHIHSIIMRPEPYAFPGEYRQVGVQVRGKVKMPPVVVRPEIETLLGACDGDLMNRQIDLLANREPTEEQLWDMHNQFEHIHPFIDGNGRTGRLWLNGLRLVAGFPWLIVREDEKHEYYQRIIDYEISLEKGETYPMHVGLIRQRESK